MARRRFSAHEKRLVAAHGGWQCAMCGTPLDATYEIDHTVPLHLGGEDTVANCRALHKWCHAKKTQLEEIERLRRLADAKLQPSPPLACTQCARIVSPYFRHVCQDSGHASRAHRPRTTFSDVPLISSAREGRGR